MANVEQRAESEAAAKGLSGQARKSYIGGVFNRIRQAHERATTPGARGRKLFNRRERVQARLDARLAMQPHREAIDVLRRQRNERIAAHQDEPRESSAQLTQRILHSDLKPIGHVEGLDIGAEMAAGPNPAHLRDIYGQQQLPQALDLFPTPSLRKAAREQGIPAGGSRRDVIARLAQPAKPAKPPKLPKLPKLPAPERQRQRAIADAIKHGAPDFPPGTLAAAQGKQAPAKRELTPVGQVDKALLDPYAPPNPHALRQLYGDAQLEAALSRYSLEALKTSARAHGVDPTASSKAALVKRLMAKAQGKSAPTGVRLSVRPYTYHGNAGYLISGSDRLGRRISIFARSKSEAERMRDDIKAGRETMFDSER